jgi:hypothetical protein
MCGKYVRRVIALAGVLGLLTLSAPVAWGAPGDTPTDANTLTLPLGDLGLPQTLAFYGAESAQQLTVPVLRGLKPTTLNATVELPLNLRSGIITVTQADHTIARFETPAADQTPIVIPLGATELINDAVTVMVRVSQVPKDGTCFNLESPLRMVNPTVSYTGVEQPPSTVAHFLPPILRTLTIFVPKSPSEAESNSAVQLAISTVARYRSHVPDINVVPLPEGQAGPSTPPRQMERQIVIKDGPNRGLSLQGPSDAPWLLISGPTRTDESDIAVLFSDVSELVAAPKAVVGSLKSSLQFPGNTTTLRDLDQGAIKSVGLQPRVAVGLDQTRFGRSIHSVRVHLQGSYSPTPANLGGEIIVSVGNETIDHWPTDANGNIDRWIDVPDRLLQRYTSLDLELNVSGNFGPCGDFFTAGAGNHLLELTINGDSTVQSSPAAPPVPDGLRSIPQALMPRVQLGIEPHSFGDTSRAVELMVGLQRISGVPLDTTVTGVQQAINSSSPAILIAADGWNHSDIVLPVSAAANGPLTINGLGSDNKPATIELDPQMRFASLQTVFNRGRQLLIATSNGAPMQLDALLKSLSGDTSRWPSLGGVALVSVPGQDAVTVSQKNLPGGTNSEGHSGLGWLWWLGGGWLIVAAIGAAVIIVRNRRRSPRT